MQRGASRERQFWQKAANYHYTGIQKIFVGSYQGPSAAGAVVVVCQPLPAQHTTARRSVYPTSPVGHGDRVTRPALLLFLVALRLTPCCLPCSTHGRADVAQGWISLLRPPSRCYCLGLHAQKSRSAILKIKSAFRCSKSAQARPSRTRSPRAPTLSVDVAAAIAGKSSSRYPRNTPIAVDVQTSTVNFRGDQMWNRPQLNNVLFSHSRCASISRSPLFVSS